MVCAIVVCALCVNIGAFCVHWRRLCPIWFRVIVWCSPRLSKYAGYLPGSWFCVVVCGSAIPCSGIFHGDTRQSLHHVTCIRDIVPGSGNCSECRWQLLYHGNDTCTWLWRTSLLQAKGVDDHPWGRITNCHNARGCPDLFNRVYNHFFPSPLHVPAPFEADALDINGFLFTVDAPSSVGSNNFDSFHKQSDTQLLPTSHEPPTNKQKIPKRRYLSPPFPISKYVSFQFLICQSMCDFFFFFLKFWHVLILEALKPGLNRKGSTTSTPGGAYIRHAFVLTNIMDFPATSYDVLILQGLKWSPSGCFFGILRIYFLWCLFTGLGWFGAHFKKIR